MAIERKCPQCNTWNEDLNYCSNCNHLLSAKIIEEKREEERETRRKAVPATKLEVFLKSWKESKYWILRVIYKILYTIAFIFIAIASLFAYLAATPNG